MNFGIRVTVLLNQIANSAGQVLLSPLGILPDLAGAVLIAIVTGVLMLLGFKYTSPQNTIKRIRARIKAELLALSLFRDSVVVNLTSQGRILLSALQSLLVSLLPIACLTIPVSLALAQLSLWWQARPLRVNEETVLTLSLNGDDKSRWPDVSLEPSSSFEPTIGPVQIRSQRALCWNIQAKEPGYHRFVFKVDGQEFDKQFAIGNPPMRISLQRPGWKWSDILLNPAESPFPPQSPIRSIEIQYPRSRGWLTGSESWLIFWFVASTITAFCFRSVFKVNL